MNTVEDKKSLMARLNQETSKIDWLQLQKFFASGSTVFVDESLDLIDIAAEMAVDNKAVLEPLVEAGKVGAVTDEKAAQWFEDKSSVWAVVVSPWVLVQRVKEK